MPPLLWFHAPFNAGSFTCCAACCRACCHCCCLRARHRCAHYSRAAHLVCHPVPTALHTTTACTCHALLHTPAFCTPHTAYLHFAFPIPPRSPHPHTHHLPSSFLIYHYHHLPHITPLLYTPTLFSITSFIPTVSYCSPHPSPELPLPVPTYLPPTACCSILLPILPTPLLFYLPPTTQASTFPGIFPYVFFPCRLYHSFCSFTYHYLWEGWFGWDWMEEGTYLPATPPFLFYFAFSLRVSGFLCRAAATWSCCARAVLVSARSHRYCATACLRTHLSDGNLFLPPACTQRVAARRRALRFAAACARNGLLHRRHAVTYQRAAFAHFSVRSHYLPFILPFTCSARSSPSVSCTIPAPNRMRSHCLHTTTFYHCLVCRSTGDNNCARARCLHARTVTRYAPIPPRRGSYIPPPPLHSIHHRFTVRFTCQCCVTLHTFDLFLASVYLP